MLAKLSDGGNDLFVLCCAKDKDGSRRGFLQGLQKGVKGLLGKHMGFVKFIDLVFALYGCIGDCIPYGPNIIYTSVGGCVYLYKVWEGAHIYGHTVFTNSARLSLLWLKTVYGLCKYSGYGGLSSPPCTSKKISVRMLPQPYGVFENSYWYFLPYHLR